MSWKRIAPYAGIAFVVFFAASVTVSTVPKDTASDHAWLAAYATHSKQAGHLATGILLVLAALSLMTFLTHIWMRVGEADASRAVSPLPVVAAGVAAACIAAGGVMMAAASGSALLYSQPLPGVDVLRLGNDVGFAMVGVAGMFAASLSIACLSVQARAAGLFGTRLAGFSLAVAVVLLASIAFMPIVALLVWLITVTVRLARRAGAPPLVRSGIPDPAAPARA
jgi:chromate transport protein ChrA